MGLIFRIIVMVIAMGSVVFVMWKLNTVGIDPALFHIESGETSSFKSDDVTHFEWKSTNKIFSYDKDQAGRWLPQKNEKNLKDLFQFLSQIQLNDVVQTGKGSLEVVLDINNERWAGSWDGLSFVWKSGPHKGKGEVLSEQKNMTFFKGAYVFDTVSIDLCKNRINKILIQAHGKNYQIEQIQRGWQVTQPAPQTLDPIFIEKWLIGLCQAKVKTILDLSYAQGNTKQGFIEFHFVDGEKLSLSHIERDFFTTVVDGQETGIVLNPMNKSLEDLKKQLNP